jgi:hypothetical protein
VKTKKKEPRELKVGNQIHITLKDTCRHLDIEEFDDGTRWCCDCGEQR